MKSIKLLTVFLGLFLSFKAQTQTIERFTLDLAGGIAETENFTIHYSIGQPFVNTIDLDVITISEGFIQGELVAMTTAIDYYPKLVAEVYPNPTFDILRVSSSEFLPNSTLRLLNVHGTVVLQSAFDQQSNLDVHLIPAGTYFLQYIDSTQQIVRQFKVIKL